MGGQVRWLVQALLREEVTQFLGSVKSARRTFLDSVPGYRNGYREPRKLLLAGPRIAVPAHIAWSQIVNPAPAHDISRSPAGQSMAAGCVCLAVSRLPGRVSYAVGQSRPLSLGKRHGYSAAGGARAHMCSPADSG